MNVRYAYVRINIPIQSLLFPWFGLERAGFAGLAVLWPTASYSAIYCKPFMYELPAISCKQIVTTDRQCTFTDSSEPGTKI
jgi:hypothetical protein